MSRTVILGGGLAGLSAAALGHPDATVLEAAPAPGGLCGSYADGGFTFDYTGHLWHFADPAVRQTVESWLGEPLREHRRRAGVWFRERMVPYPFQLALYHFPDNAAAAAITGLLRARKEDAGEQPDATLAELCRRRFGAGLTELFHAPYQQKVLGRELGEVLAAPLARFLPQPDFAAIFQSYLEPATYDGYNATFFYPRGGNGRLIAALAKRAPGLRLGAEVTAVNLGVKTVNAAGIEHRFDDLIATIPLDRLAAMTADLPAELKAAARDLVASTVIDLNLGVRGAAPRDLHWSYYPEPTYPFYRVGCYTNFAPELAPAGAYSLYVELPGTWWDAQPEATRLPAVYEALRECGWLPDPGAVTVASVRRLAPAYVVPTPAGVAARAGLLAWYRERGVTLLGRFAEWDYLAMDDIVAAALGRAERAR